MNFSKVGMKYVAYSYDQRSVLFYRENAWKQRACYKGNVLVVNQATVCVCVCLAYTLLATYHLPLGVFFSILPIRLNLLIVQRFLFPFAPSPSNARGL